MTESRIFSNLKINFCSLFSKLLFLMLFLELFFLVHQNYKKEASMEVSTVPETKKIIAFANYDPNWWIRVFTRLLNSECGDPRCVISTEFSALEKADVIITVHLGNKFKGKFNELNRNPNAFYVYYIMEAFTKFKPLITDNWYHWTMSHRRDSDIHSPYGRVIKRQKKRPVSEINYVTKESLESKKFAIWMAGHCETASKREDLVLQMSRLIPIDIYGKCGTLTCGAQQFVKVIDEEVDPCLRLLEQYSFYLSFENSLCEDYVSEKFYRVLGWGAIPVVYGAADYSLFAPPNSYIDVKEFKNNHELVTHLKRVANNATLYNEYLKWQEDYDIEVAYPYKPFVCDICNKLHEVQDSKIERLQVRKNITPWYTDYKDNRCYKSLQELRNKYAKS